MTETKLDELRINYDHSTAADRARAERASDAAKAQLRMAAWREEINRLKTIKIKEESL